MKRILSSFGITAATVALIFVGFGCETYNEIDPKALKESSTVTTEKTLSQGDEPSESQKNMESKIDELMAKVNSQSSSASDEEIAALKEQIAALQETIEDLKANPPVKEEPPSSEPPDSSPPPSGDKADKAPPKIKEKSPTGNDVSVTSKKIVVTFNEKLADDAVTKESLSIDPPVTVKNVTDSNPTFTFTLKKSLEQGKEYEVTLSKDGIKDVAGNELVSDKEWKFTTKQAEVAVVEAAPVTATVVPAAPVTATPAAPAAVAADFTGSVHGGTCEVVDCGVGDECDIDGMTLDFSFSGKGILSVALNCEGGSITEDQLTNFLTYNPGKEFNNLMVRLSNGADNKEKIPIYCHPIGKTADPAVNKELDKIGHTCDDDNYECPYTPDSQTFDITTGNVVSHVDDC